MARIQGSPARNVFARIVYWALRRKFGTVPASVRIAAHHPRVLKGFAEMETALTGAQRLDPKLKSLLQVRVAMRVGCLF